MDDFGDVFGEAKPPEDSPPPQRPVLFHAHAHAHAGSRSLRLVASDLHSLAWDRSLSVPDLDDLRDDVGIGGSLSDFLEYLKSCLSSGEVKLILSTADRNLSPPTGLDRVNLVATKAKGLPRITISLNRVTASAVNDVIANLSLSLYTAYRTMQDHASREQERASQLMDSLSSAKEKNELMQKQLEALSFLEKRKATKPKFVANQGPSVSGVSVTQGSDQIIIPAEQHTSALSPSKVSPAKVTKRIAPTSRRARVRGALLQDTEENVDE
ncbi:hypothetical protein GUJ93_ZPchr0004g39543 [Zizania palustris]|uniref:Uncharacterized protein n=1 Tax=Zizania palustris TaxID=103762 RepID=A0A8J5VGV4_ZIZPA|nr:hypothetical protein GUJ93_ZPchr0004g39543 [Zizania palustris]